MNLCNFSYEEHDNSASVWREERINKTRKDHRCSECGDKIAKGERCTKASGLIDGTWNVWFRCVSCTLFAEYLAQVMEECPLWGGLQDYADNCATGGVGTPTLREWKEKVAQGASR